MDRGGRRYSQDDLERVDGCGTDYTNSVFLAAVMARQRDQDLPFQPSPPNNDDGRSQISPIELESMPKHTTASTKALLNGAKKTMGFNESGNVIADDRKRDQNLPNTSSGPKMGSFQPIRPNMDHGGTKSSRKELDSMQKQTAESMKAFASAAKKRSGLNEPGNAIADDGHRKQNLPMTSSRRSFQPIRPNKKGSVNPNSKEFDLMQKQCADSTKAFIKATKKKLGLDDSDNVITDDTQRDQDSPNTSTMAADTTLIQALQRKMEEAGFNFSQEQLEVFVAKSISDRDFLPIFEVQAQLRDRNLPSAGSVFQLRARLHTAFAQDEYDGWTFNGSQGWRFMPFDGLGTNPQELKGRILMCLQNVPEKYFNALNMTPSKNPELRNVVASPSAVIQLAGEAKSLMLQQREMNAVGISGDRGLCRLWTGGECPEYPRIVDARAVEVKTVGWQRGARALAVLCEGMPKWGFVYCVKKKPENGKMVLGGDLWIQ